MRIFAISDIHGCQKTFLTLLDRIGLQQDDQLYLLGDYIDRGPASKGVFDSITNLQTQGYHVHCLRGNHEQMLLDARTDPYMASIWMKNGGIQALQSFQVSKLADIPQPYFDFMENCAHYFEQDAYLFVHAGLNLELPNPLADKKSMLWIRKWEEKGYLSWLAGRKVIHGHTPQKRIDIERRFEAFAQGKHPILNIDRGCVYDKVAYHQLCAVELTGMRLFFEKNVG